MFNAFNEIKKPNKIVIEDIVHSSHNNEPTTCINPVDKYGIPVKNSARTLPKKRNPAKIYSSCEINDDHDNDIEFDTNIVIRPTSPTKWNNKKIHSLPVLHETPSAPSPSPSSTPTCSRSSSPIICSHSDSLRIQYVDELKPRGYESTFEPSMRIVPVDNKGTMVVNAPHVDKNKHNLAKKNVQIIREYDSNEEYNSCDEDDNNNE